MPGFRFSLEMDERRGDKASTCSAPLRLFGVRVEFLALKGALQAGETQRRLTLHSETPRNPLQPIFHLRHDLLPGRHI
jgi:hypothetical protein